MVSCCYASLVARSFANRLARNGQLHEGATRPFDVIPVFVQYAYFAIRKSQRYGFAN